jgi:hypothetical protein
MNNQIFSILNNSDTIEPFRRTRQTERQEKDRGENTGRDSRDRNKKKIFFFDDGALHVSTRNKIRHYLSVYTNSPDPIAFIPIAVSTSAYTQLVLLTLRAQ